MERRKFCTLTGSAVVSLSLGIGCRRQSSSSNDGRITARPRRPAPSSTATLADIAHGKAISLGLDRERDAVLYLPRSANAPVPLLMFLHGATQSADDMAWYLDSAPEETGVAILAPNSRATTWDAISGAFGEDVEFLNRALQRTFEMLDVDNARLTIGGFSDGATYAIALGLINGGLFKHVLACSPGFVIDVTTQGKPNFFISHGTQDNILPIERCGRRVAADLKSRGYEVTFREFAGRHEIPGDVMRAGLNWLIRP